MIKKNNESSEDYLERILMLQEQGDKEVHAIDIATSMGFSKASVSIALKKLEEEGLVDCSPKQVLTLTQKGFDVANKVYERHKIIGHMFISLGVDEEIAYEDACKIEHDLSEESFQALKKHYLEDIAPKSEK